MKDSEDEAFDDLARKQGDWGGGYQAKKKMAADKLHWSDCAVHNAPAYPAGKCDCGVAQEPAQEPVACVMGTYGGMFVVGPLNAAIVLPVGMALYATPQHTTTWVGLTDEEIGKQTILAGFNPEWKIEIGMVFSIVRNLEAKLRSKNAC
jgi:hypothetical protein